MKLSEKYRQKALISEKLARDATDCDVKSAWTEIAIEWHALASRSADCNDEKKYHVVELDDRRALRNPTLWTVEEQNA